MKLQYPDLADTRKKEDDDTAITRNTQNSNKKYHTTQNMYNGQKNSKTFAAESADDRY